MRNLLFLLMMSLLLWGVASCGPGNSATAAAYIDALNARDLERAQALVCEEYQDDATMGLVTVAGPPVQAFEFTNVACTARGSDVRCRFTVEQLRDRDDVEGIAGIRDTLPREVTFNFEDGLICGFEEQVAN